MSGFQLLQSHRIGASYFGGGLVAAATLSYIIYAARSKRNIGYRALVGFLWLNFADAIYDTGMYFQFWVYGPSYFNRLLHISAKESIAPHLTGCFVEGRILHEVMRDKGLVEKKSASELILVKVWRNIGRKRMARWFNVK